MNSATGIESLPSPPVSETVEKRSNKFSLLRKILARTLIGLSVLANLVVITVGVLYWLYPVQFTEKVRYYYDPYEKTELVVSEKPPDTSVPLAQSTLVDVALPFFEKEQRHALIYLPKGYQAGNKDVRYPTIYLLHGYPGTEIEWPQKGKAQVVLDEAIDKHIIPPVIGVIPNGHPYREDSEFINSADGKEPVEDFIVKTVVSYVDTTYPTYADSKFRAISGLSEGGFGALNLGLKHQDVFGYIIAISGYGNVDAGAKTVSHNAKTIHDNSPTVYVPELKLHATKILMTVGDQDAWYLKENRELANVLKEHGFSVDLRNSTGKHNWPFFTAHLQEGLVWWGKLMAQDLSWEGSTSATK